MQYLRAIHEQRGAAFSKVQSALLQLREMRDEECRRFAFARRQLLETREQRIVGETGQGRQQFGVHGPHIPRDPWTLQEPSSAAGSVRSSANVLQTSTSSTGGRLARVEGLRGRLSSGPAVRCRNLSTDLFGPLQLGPDPVVPWVMVCLAGCVLLNGLIVLVCAQVKAVGLLEDMSPRISADPCGHAR